MPIDDERRRFGKAKAIPDTKPQTALATEGELGKKGDVRESLQKLQETLLLHQGESAAARVEEDKRIEANKEAAERVRNKRNEKYERLRQAFERMNRWMAEEEAEAAREESKRVQGLTSLFYLDSDLVRYD